MKRRSSFIWTLSVVGLAALIFTACDFLFDASDSSLESDEPNSRFYYALNSENSITLTGVNGKRIVYANYNNAAPLDYKNSKFLFNQDAAIAYNNSMCIPGEKLRGLVAINGNYVRSAVAGSEGEEAEKIPVCVDELPVPAIRHYVDKFSLPEANELAKIDFSNVEAINSYNIVRNDYKVGDSRNFVLEVNDVYKSEPMCLRAIGKENDKTICYVWVKDSCFDDTSSPRGSKINSAYAKEVADTFAKYYNFEREIFGKESDNLLVYTGLGFKLESMASQPTGTVVNILVYDFSDDTILGYVSSKDCYKNFSYNQENISNASKCFYLNACFFNQDENDSFTGSVTGKVHEDIISTLFHEFQHMIHCNQKLINARDYAMNNDSSTWYDEMLSMLAEDIMSKELNIKSSAWGRFSELNPAGYIFSGVDEYNLEITTASYAINYAFGSFLIRNYGGALLAKNMSQSTAKDWTSVVNAIYKTTNKQVTSRQLIKQFIESLIFRPSFAEKNNLPSLYKSPSNDISYNEFSTYVKPLNLYSIEFSWDNQGSNNYGPRILKATDFPSEGNNNFLPLRPHGFIFHNVCVATTDTVTLTFSPRKASSEQILIFVQDDFDETQADPIS